VLAGTVELIATTLEPAEQDDAVAISLLLITMLFVMFGLPPRDPEMSTEGAVESDAIDDGKVRLGKSAFRICCSSLAEKSEDPVDSAKFASIGVLAPEPQSPLPLTTS